jgi:hypothetical protein
MIKKILNGVNGTFKIYDFQNKVIDNNFNIIKRSILN